MKRLTQTILMTVTAAPALAQTGPSPARPAQSGPQPVTRATFMQRIDSAFVGIDANKDGFTDRAEIEAAEGRAMTARKAGAIREREAVFRRLDSNKDGSLTLQEYNAVAAATALPKANATPFLNRLDTNKDGKVSLAENRVPAMARFDRVDTNKDGTLSVEEQRAAAAAARR
jgi:hypothetical protein